MNDLENYLTKSHFVIQISLVILQWIGVHISLNDIIYPLPTKKP